ncbi:MAG: UDP-glucose 6-dehydrogenase YwqF [Bacteroidia bacterium]|nr:UDP-glucose 6-dehydrogenase YwqF [Bacteroidia bacterium]
MKKIGVIGAGKLGLCFALNLEKSGFEVYAVDIAEDYVNLLQTRSFNSSEPGVNDLLHESKSFFVSTKTETIINDDLKDIFIMVATPSLPDGSYNHTHIEKVTDELTAFGKRKNVVHLYIGCTTMPGYCNKLAEKMQVYNYMVSYNPEFIAQGNIILDQQYPDQVLIGEGSIEAGDRLEKIYKKMVRNNPIFCRMDRLSAEIAKLATNCFLTTKISFANSIGDLAIKSGADHEKILAAVGADSRIGKKYLNYGFGFGGPCFPRDNKALGVFAKSQNCDLKISEATDAINKTHLEFQVKHYLKKYLPEEVIPLDYVSYKKGSVIIEESQQLALAVALAKAGRKVKISDRKEVINEVEKLYPGLFDFVNQQ